MGMWWVWWWVWWWVFDVYVMGIWRIWWWLFDVYMVCMWWVCDGYVMIMWWFYDGYVMGIWWVCDGYVMGVWCVCDGHMTDEYSNSWKQKPKMKGFLESIVDVNELIFLFKRALWSLIYSTCHSCFLHSLDLDSLPRSPGLDKIRFPIQMCFLKFLSRFFLKHSWILHYCLWNNLFTI